MKTHKAPVWLFVAMLILLVATAIFSQLTKVVIAETKEKMAFYRHELSMYHPASGKHLEVDVLTRDLSSKAENFQDAERVANLAAMLMRGVKHDSVPLQSKYLATFLEADEAYKAAGLTSQAWEDLRFDMRIAVRMSKEAWVKDLDRIEAQARALAEPSVAFIVADTLAPILTLGNHDGIPHIEGFDKRIEEILDMSRATINKAIERLLPEAQGSARDQA